MMIWIVKGGCLLILGAFVYAAFRALTSSMEKNGIAEYAEWD